MYLTVETMQNELPEAIATVSTDPSRVNNAPTWSTPHYISQVFALLPHPGSDPSVGGRRDLVDA